ncbi:hypothetical protein [Lacinutrix sp. Bg11-31]|uniref:hypothetical protein n=1 Tax=Lacinutrix sp. Bg11-31 TaxID=2057808 RepID=UPI000C318590|nr:hypothetical protein [Lacinutrix sp. Bg11-31]AUC82197.1 hypothetical protein CW733_08670 [Lacinutrix sp. Bg11-31]
MKYFLHFLLLLICFQLSAQTIEIDVTSQIEELTIPSDINKYNFKMTHVEKTSIYKIKVKKEDLKIEVLKTPTDFASINGLAEINNLEISIGDFNLDKGQQLTIEIQETKKDGKEGTHLKRIYTTQQRGEWRTTFGFNFIFLTNQETYYSKTNTDEDIAGSYIITEGNNKEKFQYHPTLMFTWLSKNHLFGNANWKHGFSGGIGYDFKTSLSIFSGYSIIYNENITITTGVAFHNHKRLSSNYSNGDSINENLTFDQLHTDYIRANPFVSFSFRLDKNPFK